MFKYYFKLAIFLLLSATWINAVNASTTLKCEIENYELSGDYRKEWAIKIIPEHFDIEIDKTGNIKFGAYQKHLVTSDTINEIIFKIKFPNRYDGASFIASFHKQTKILKGSISYNPQYGGKRVRFSGVCSEITPIQSASSSNPSSQSSSPTSAELLAAQQEAETLKQQLAELESQQSQTQQSASTDTQIPLITITRADTDDKQGVIAGRVSDNVGVAEVTIDGNIVPLMSNGSFEYSTYVPATGLSVVVEVTDLAGLSSTQTITLERNINLATASISFDRLNPIAKPVKSNNNALALIIGVSNYENTPAKAIFADSDAMVFHDYASEKLGIPNNRIKTLVNDGADEREMLLAVQTWLTRSVKQDQTDVYVFFAGHGLASDDGEQMYLLPYDGSPELLDDTAILRDRLFNDIAKANPRSVTVFLDTCYSGSNRGSEMLIAARPILLKAKDSAVPQGFTVFTAAAGDETAKPLEEAKHGLFSYFLMKGMEGDADSNGDKQITAGELHAYVKSNVVQQSSGTQTPELQGDEDRVLVRFQ